MRISEVMKSEGAGTGTRLARIETEGFAPASEPQKKGVAAVPIGINRLQRGKRLR